MSEFDSGLEIAKRALEQARKEVGPVHADPERIALERARDAVIGQYGEVSCEAAAALYLLADYLKKSPQALPIWFRLLRVEEQVFGPLPDSEPMGTLNNLALTLRRSSRKTESELLYRWGMALEPANPTGYYNLGRHFDDERKFQEAMPLLERVVEFGDESDALTLGKALHSLADCYAKQIRHVEAHHAFERGIALLRTCDVPHELANMRHNFGVYLRRQGELEAARDQFKQAIEFEVEAVGPGESLSTSLSSLAKLVPEFCNRGEFAEAKKVYQFITSVNDHEFAGAATDTARILACGLALQLGQGDAKAARAQLEAACDAAEDKERIPYVNFFDSAQSVLCHWGARELVKYLCERAIDWADSLEEGERESFLRHVIKSIEHWGLHKLTLRLWRMVLETDDAPWTRIHLLPVLIENDRDEEALAMITSGEEVFQHDYYQQLMHVAASRIAAKRGDIEFLENLLDRLEADIPVVEKHVPSQELGSSTSRQSDGDETEFDSGLTIAEQAVASARQRIGNGHTDPELTALELARVEIFAKYGQVSREAAGLLYLLGNHLEGRVEGLRVWFDLLNIEQQVFGPIPHEETIGTIDNIAIHYSTLEMWDEAEMLYRWAIALDPDTASWVWNLGRLFTDKESYVQAIGCYEQVLAMGDAAPKDTLGMAGPALGSDYAQFDRFAEARPLFPVAVDILAETDEHGEYATGLHQWGYFLSDRDELDASVPYMKHAIALNERFVGPSDELDTSLEVLTTIVRKYGRRGQIETAEELHDYLRTVYERVDHPDYGEVKRLVVAQLELYLCRGEEEAARQELLRVLEFAKGLDAETCLKIIHAADVNLRYWGAKRLAELLARECIAWLPNVGEKHLAGAIRSLENLVQGWGFAELRLHLRQMQWEDSPTVWTGLDLAELQIEVGQFDQAEQTLTELPRDLEEEHEEDAREIDQCIANHRLQIAARRGDVPALREFLAELEASVLGELEEEDPLPE